MGGNICGSRVITRMECYAAMSIEGIADLRETARRKTLAHIRFIQTKDTETDLRMQGRRF
jgi:hypothetical protein